MEPTLQLQQDGLSQEDADLNVYPEHVALNLERPITLGDMHGNTMKLVWTLIRQGALKLQNPGDYQKLLSIYNQKWVGTSLVEAEGARKDLLEPGEVYKNPDPEFAKKQIKEFETILSNATFDTRARVRLLGDVIGDRGNNDWLTFLLLKRMTDAGVKTQITASDHDFFFLNCYGLGAKHPNELPTDQYTNSFVQHFYYLIDKNVITYEELKTMVEKFYLPKLVLLSGGVSNNKQEISLFMHAPNGLDVIEYLAHELNVSYEATNAESLAKTIDEINNAFQKLFVTDRKRYNELVSQSIANDVDRAANSKNVGESCPDYNDRIVTGLAKLIWSHGKRLDTTGLDHYFKKEDVIRELGSTYLDSLNGLKETEGYVNSNDVYSILREKFKDDDDRVSFRAASNILGSLQSYLQGTQLFEKNSVLAALPKLPNFVKESLKAQYADTLLSSLPDFVRYEGTGHVGDRSDNGIPLHPKQVNLDTNFGKNTASKLEDRYNPVMQNSKGTYAVYQAEEEAWQPTFLEKLNNRIGAVVHLLKNNWIDSAEAEKRFKTIVRECPDVDLTKYIEPSDKISMTAVRAALVSQVVLKILRIDGGLKDAVAKAEQPQAHQEEPVVKEAKRLCSLYLDAHGKDKQAKRIVDSIYSLLSRADVSAGTKLVAMKKIMQIENLSEVMQAVSARSWGDKFVHFMGNVLRGHWHAAILSSEKINSELRKLTNIPSVEAPKEKVSSGPAP